MLVDTYEGISITRGEKEIIRSQSIVNTLHLGLASRAIDEQFKEVMEVFVDASRGSIIYDWNFSPILMDNITHIMELKLHVI